MGTAKPATRERGSKTVNMKRGMGARIDAIARTGCEIGSRGFEMVIVKVFTPIPRKSLEHEGAGADVTDVIAFNTEVAVPQSGLYRTLGRSL